MTPTESKQNAYYFNSYISELHINDNFYLPAIKHLIQSYFVYFTLNEIT
jgi:hypothetical protein